MGFLPEVFATIPSLIPLRKYFYLQRFLQSFRDFLRYLRKRFHQKFFCGVFQKFFKKCLTKPTASDILSRVSSRMLWEIQSVIPSGIPRRIFIFFNCSCSSIKNIYWNALRYTCWICSDIPPRVLQKFFQKLLKINEEFFMVSIRNFWRYLLINSYQFPG